MATKDELFTKLGSGYKFEKIHDIVLAIIEATVVLIAGGFLGSTIQSYNPNHLLIGIGLSILFLYLFFRRLAKEQWFSVSALGELRAALDLEEAKKDIERKNVIDIYIADAITALNSNTCNYNSIETENHLCDTGIENGFKSIYQPFFSNAPSLLNTPKAKFTIGCYLHWVVSLMPNYLTVASWPVRSTNVYIPQDDFGMRHYFVTEPITNTALRDAEYHFAAQIQNTFKHGTVITAPITLNDVRYTYLTASIPTVCDDGSTGVFFMIFEGEIDLPPDFVNLTKIFGRLFSNWLDKYGDCIQKRVDSANRALGVPVAPFAAMETPPEVVALQEAKKRTVDLSEKSEPPNSK